MDKKRYLFSLLLLTVLHGCASYFYPGTEYLSESIIKTLGVRPANCGIRSGAVLSESVISEDRNGQIKRVVINSCGNAVPAYVAIPRVVRAGNPVVIALHQTANVGKDEVMGIRGEPGFAYGKKFLQSGFIVVSPDIFLAGENYDMQSSWDTEKFYREYPNWSAMGRMLQDNIAASNYARREFSPTCMSAVGHSLGGHNALFLSAFDGDIDVVVSSAGFESIARDEHAERWARRSLFVYMPELREVVETKAPRKVPWDFDDILNLISPRPVLVMQGRNDENWNANSAADMVFSANQRSGLGTPLIRLLLHDRGHDFSEPLQDAAVQFVSDQCQIIGPRVEATKKWSIWIG